MNRYQKLMSNLASHDCWECDTPVPHDCRPDHPRYAETVAECPYQLRDALILYVGGGYGMYFDWGPGHGEPVAVLCKDCAKRMAELFPQTFEILSQYEAETWEPSFELTNKSCGCRIRYEVTNGILSRMILVQAGPDCGHTQDDV